eukprot:gene2088-18944_t
MLRIAPLLAITAGTVDALADTARPAPACDCQHKGLACCGQTTNDGDALCYDPDTQLCCDRGPRGPPEICAAAGHVCCGGVPYAGCRNSSLLCPPTRARVTQPAPAPPASYPGNFSIVPNDKCPASASSACIVKGLGSCRLCYQGSKAELNWVQTTDPFYMCKHEKSDILPGTCVEYGYTIFTVYDPTIGKYPWSGPISDVRVSIWRQDTDTLAGTATPAPACDCEQKGLACCGHNTRAGHGIAQCYDPATQLCCDRAPHHSPTICPAA